MNKHLSSQNVQKNWQLLHPPLLSSILSEVWLKLPWMLIQRCTPDIKKHIDGSSYQPLFNHFTPKCDSFFSSLAAWLHISCVDGLKQKNHCNLQRNVKHSLKITCYVFMMLLFWAVLFFILSFSSWILRTKIHKETWMDQCRQWNWINRSNRLCPGKQVTTILLSLSYYHTFKV